MKGLLVRADDVVQRVSLLAKRVQGCGVDFAREQETIADRRGAAHHASPEQFRLKGHVRGGREHHAHELCHRVLVRGGGDRLIRQFRQDSRALGVNDFVEFCPKEWGAAEVHRTGEIIGRKVGRDIGKDRACRSSVARR